VQPPPGGVAPFLELVNGTSDDFKLALASVLISSVQKPVCYTEDELLAEMEERTKRFRFDSISHDMAKRVLGVKFAGGQSCGATDYSKYSSDGPEGMFYIPKDTCYGKGKVTKRADKLFLTTLADLVLAKAHEFGLPGHPYELDSVDPFADEGGPYKPTVIIRPDDDGYLTKVKDYDHRVIYDTTGAEYIRDRKGRVTTFADGESWLEELDFVANDKGSFELGHGIRADGGGDPSTFKDGVPLRNPESFSKLWELLGLSRETFTERYKTELIRTIGMESRYNLVARQNAERLHGSVLGLGSDWKEDDERAVQLEKTYTVDLPDYVFELQ